MLQVYLAIMKCCRQNGAHILYFDRRPSICPIATKYDILCNTHVLCQDLSALQNLREFQEEKKTDFF